MRKTILAALVVLAAGGCAPHDRAAEELTGGDIQRGRVAIRQYGCQTCHVIPGVTGADALVGPPLNGIGSRRYLGGVVPNTFDGMVAWVQNPKAFEPLSAMPVLGVTERDARDIAAYLYTLH